MQLDFKQCRCSLIWSKFDWHQVYLSSCFGAVNNDRSCQAGQPKRLDQLIQGGQNTTSCKSGFFLSIHVINNRFHGSCIQCPPSSLDCPSGNYKKDICINNGDGSSGCSACRYDNSGDPLACSACQAECKAGFFETHPCTSSSNRQCKKVGLLYLPNIIITSMVMQVAKLYCDSGADLCKHLSSALSYFHSVQCDSYCSSTNPLGNYEVVDCTPTSNRVCTFVSICPQTFGTQLSDWWSCTSSNRQMTYCWMGNAALWISVLEVSSTELWS